jgi:hypothetical protein
MDVENLGLLEAERQTRLSVGVPRVLCSISTLVNEAVRHWSSRLVEARQAGPYRLPEEVGASSKARRQKR